MLLSIKFTRSLPPKVIKNVKRIRSLANIKREIFLLRFFKVYALRHDAKSKILLIAKLNVDFTIKFSKN